MPCSSAGQNLGLRQHRSQGQRKPKAPCFGCGLNKNLCICAQIPRLELKTRVVLIIHAKELKRTTNTGTLATAALVNSEIKVRGLGHENLQGLLNPAYQSLLFYPAKDAIELTPELITNFNKPIQLIVPDGNWRQASKVHTRYKEFADLPRVMLSQPNLATQHLRTETTNYGMSTLEAIAKAIGITESILAGVTEGQFAEQQLMNLYKAKLENTLKGRPRKTIPSPIINCPRRKLEVVL
jgi:DTW domain-containing protein YfiP